MKATAPKQNLRPYRAIVATAEGRHYGTYLDWFADDAAAVVGFSEIMAEQGYPRVRVEIGDPSIVHILP